MCIYEEPRVSAIAMLSKYGSHMPASIAINREYTVALYKFRSGTRLESYSCAVELGGQSRFISITFFDVR